MRSLKCLNLIGYLILYFPRSKETRSCFSERLLRNKEKCSDFKLFVLYYGLLNNVCKSLNTTCGCGESRK